MSRHERDFEPVEPVGAAERAQLERQAAIACCLSGRKGWREASLRLGGAFASAAAGLTQGQEE